MCPLLSCVLGCMEIETQPGWPIYLHAICILALSLKFAACPRRHPSLTLSEHSAPQVGKDGFQVVRCTISRCTATTLLTYAGRMAGSDNPGWEYVIP